VLSRHHYQQLIDRGFTRGQIDSFEQGLDQPWVLKSLAAKKIQEEWLTQFPSMRGQESDALLLRFNETTFSLRPDDLVIDGDRKKYLYMKSDLPGQNTQPWVPSGAPVIATEGLFDALAATYLMKTPCCGATAPSHLGRSQFPASVKVYVSDADVPFHHSEGLLSMVVGLCREKNLKLAHLPRNPAASYCFVDKIPDECKWGMDEWARHWSGNAQYELQKIIDKAMLPVAYMRSLFDEYRLVGLTYPANAVTLANAARAIADATTRDYERRSLRDLLSKSTSCPKRWIDELITRRLASIQKKENYLAGNIADLDALKRKCVQRRLSKFELQEFIQSEYQVRFNQLTQLIELEGNPMADIDLADQFLADLEGLEVQKQTAKDAFEYVGRSNQYNPIREYLKGLRDRDDLRLIGMEEIAAVFGISPNDQLSRELLSRHLVGHVVRGLDPENAQHHQMLILYGSQGTGKSKTLAAMAGSDWFDSATTIKKGELEDWNFLPKVNGAWVFEFDECEKIIRSTTAAEFKGFITRQSDRYTEKFKSYKANHPRRSCLWGTTNDSQVLNDPTGSRRFWVIETGDRQLKPSWFAKNRDSFWATVMTWNDWGLANWLDQASRTAQAASERAQQLSLGDPLELQLREALESHAYYKEVGVSQATLIRRHLYVDPVKASRDLQMRITRIITSHSFRTHSDTVNWKSAKKRFKDINGQNMLVPGPSLHGYIPESVVPSVPSEVVSVGTVLLPWQDPDLVSVFQPFQHD
jgi:predicted P-loop ATPase